MKRVGLSFRVESKMAPYRAALRAAGLEPVDLTPGSTASLDGLAGLVLSGGTDIDPQQYGEDRHPTVTETDPDRDQLERTLIEQALKQRLPVLAICRGMQMLNVALGGTLTQHVEGHRHPGVEEAHEVTIAPDSKLAAIFGPGPRMVNSRHHQVAGRIGDGLIVTACGEYVEGVEHKDYPFIVGVQWHPEDRKADAPLFDAFSKHV